MSGFTGTGMTNRERLLTVLRGEQPDRVPIWLLYPWHPVSYYTDVRSNPVYARVVEASLTHAVHLNRRNFLVAAFAPGVEDRIESWADGSRRYTKRTISWKGKTLQELPGVRKLLESDEDLEFFCSLPVNTDRAAIRAELDSRYRRYESEKAEFPPDLGAMMLDLGEPIGLLYHASSLLEYPVWSLTHADMVEDLLRRLQEQFLAVYRYFLERDAADVYFLVGSELASPPMVSPDTFRRWIIPFARELIDLVHSRGKFVIQHYHGQIRDILPDFLEMAPDGLHTIEAPPVGNCTLRDAFEITGNRITLIGNIQYDDFRALTPAQMREAVREVIREADGRRFILSPTAGPYEDTVSDRFIENYLAFLQAGFEFGRLRA